MTHSHVINNLYVNSELPILVHKNDMDRTQILQTDGHTDKVTPIYPPKLRLWGGGGVR